MNQKILGLAVAAMLIVALLSQTIQMDEDAPHARVLSGLQASLDEVERVEIYSLGDEAGTLAISRNDQVWVLENRSGYPIDFEELLEVLDKLASAELIEEKTAKAELLGHLGLAASGEDDAVGVMQYELVQRTCRSY